MAGKGRTFVIAGAGIAGLTLALALAKFGAGVLVLERNPSIQEFGAGLQISPNARRVLERLGVERFLTPVGFEPAALDVYPFTRTEPVARMRFGPEAQRRFGHPYAVFHRADLAQALYQACKRFANIDILFNVESFDVSTHSRGLAVSADVGDGKKRTARPFAFIGADGVNSRTRTVILGGRAARQSGSVAWRTLVDLDALKDLVDLQDTSLFLGPGYHAVIYPLPHRSQANVALFTPAPESLAFADERPGRIRLPRSHRDSAMFRRLIEAAGENWTRWPMATVNLSDWHHGAVGLIGDAAHAMLPFQAQGAAMAIEDAAILAPFLMTEPDAPTAFQRFHSIRAPRVSRVATVSARNGRIFHMRWPFSMARDLVMAQRADTAHLDQLSWLYGYDPTPDVSLPARGRSRPARHNRHPMPPQ